MARYLKLIVVVLYIWFTVTLVYIAAVLSFDLVLPNGAVLYVGVLYTIICFSSVYWLTWMYLNTGSVRQPFKDELSTIEKCFDDVIQKTQREHKYNFYVHETAEWVAYAIGSNNIVVSRGLLENFTTDQVESILAHELGHLRSKDTFAGAALAAAFWVPSQFILFGQKVTRIFRFQSLSSIVLFMMIISFGLLTIVYQTSIDFVGFLILLIFVMSFLNAIAKFFANWFGRLIEYKQDAFAASLGYAAPLISALQKFRTKAGGRFSVINTVLYGTHPLLHNRIIRLEKFI